MSIENAIARRTELYNTIGKAALNVRYPKEFELYMCALELIDQEGKTLKYFIFPIMPSAINEQEPGNTSIKRTLAGITALTTTTFTPVTISMSGNFGKRFKILLGTDYVELLSAFQTVDGKVTLDSIQQGLSTFDSRIKTGYGCLNVLKDILDQAKVVDQLGPRRLVLYNLAFGTSYVVKEIDRKIDMNQETNMIHGYNVVFKAIAPLDALKSKDQLEADASRLVITDYAQKQTENLLNIVTSIIS